MHREVESRARFGCSPPLELMAGTRPLTKSSFGLRWVMLLLASLLMLGVSVSETGEGSSRELLDIINDYRKSKGSTTSRGSRSKSYTVEGS